MPSRGYRKGISDRKVPVPASVRTHISQGEYEQLKAEAKARGITLSRLVRKVLAAHIAGHRAELPHMGRTTDAFLRDYARLGNNLNQLVRQANRMRLHLIVSETLACLAALEAQAKAFTR
ncbi:MAG: plasmid mobilization relaxosome protein MobC [Hyphomicrobiaceae bacterium]